MKERSVFYALNRNAKYLYMLGESLKSLRVHDKKVNVQTFFYGAPKSSFLRSLEKYDVEIKICRRLPDDQGTYLKWHALNELGNMASVMFVDADTYFFKSATALFKKYQIKDFYAREEAGMSRKKHYSFILGEIESCQLDHRAYSKLAKRLDAKVGPVFNTGVMIFNNVSHKKVGPILDGIDKLRTQFKRGQLAYPCLNMHIAEEICASLMLGTIKNFKCGLIERRDSPWYVEWKGRDVAQPGFLMHIFTKYYPAFLLDFKGEQSLIKYTDVL
jgi:hypothetical protein